MFWFSKFSFNYPTAISKRFLLSHIFSTSSPPVELAECGDASAWAPGASTCQQTDPNQMRPKRSLGTEPSQSQSQARQPPKNNHNNLHIDDPNQIPNQILCLCHHRKAAPRHRCCWLPKQLKAKLFITISAREAKKQKKKEKKLRKNKNADVNKEKVFHENVSNAHLVVCACVCAYVCVCVCG